MSGVSGANPSATTASLQPEETVGYDAFGNRAKSVDRNGNAAWNWYDSLDRVVASVDEAGYLTEFAYDDQGNVVRQTKYGTALDVATLGVASRPAAPAGTAYVTDRVYDKANRLLSETLPTVTVYTGTATLTERPVTKFSYDKNGNLVRKRLAADTTSETSEYIYYDAADRQVAVVNALGVLHTIGYDANGNKVAFQRFLTPLTRTSAQLASDTLATLQAAVTTSVTGDQQTTYAFDAGKRQIKSTDLMGAGDSDDIVIQTWYDAAGLQSRRTDPDGYTSQTARDALGHVTQTVSPDGNRSFIEYDAAGLQTLAWTGDLGSNAASAATGVTASIGDTLAIAWNTTGRGLTTWVAWDTVAHDKPADYAKLSAKQGGGSASTELSLAGVTAGAKVYFRIVTVDAAGSSAWTAESSITVPVMLSGVSVATGTSGLELTVVFNGAATTPQLRYGATGSATLASSVNFVLQSGNTWKATIASPAGGGQGLSWQLGWTANGGSYTTAATAFDAPGVHAATGPVNKWTVSWPVPAASQGTSQLVLLGGARIDNAFQVNGQLQFDPGSMAANSSRVAQVFYGNAASSAHTATVSWSQLQKQSFSAGLTTTVVVGTSTFYDTAWNVSWINDSSSALKTSVSTTLDSTESARVNAGGVRVGYRSAGTGATFGTEVALARSGNTYSADLTLTAGASYDLKFFYIDTDGREVIIEWRTVSVPAAPSSSAASPATVVTRSSSATVPTQPTPASPRTIGVGLAQAFGGKSLIVLGRETDGTLSRSNGNALSVDAGLYSGPVDPGAAAFSVTPVATASAGAGAQKASGLTTASYYTEFLYDAIGSKVATNEDTGLWRRYGVDAMGNALRTSVYGAKADETAGSSAVVTYAAYDARGLEVARFGAAVFNDSNADGVDDATAARAVTRSSYDYDKRKISQTDPGNSAANTRTFSYDGLGKLVAQKDALGNVTSIAYDRRGHEVRRVDALGHEVKSQYDLYGRKTSDTDGLGNVTSYGYDAFDRMTRQTDARGNIGTLEYDQHDRLIRVVDALANVTQYSYDKRDNRTWTRDANDNYFGVAYDEMRRVSARYSFQGGAPSSFADAADAVTSSANAAHAFLVAETTGYDVYGNKILEVDAEKRQKVYSYGAFGRLATQTDEGGRVTSFSYDRYGRLTAEARPDDDTTSGAKAISRTYDDAGRLKSVSDTATSVSTSYTYTAAGLRAHETVRAPGLASTSAVATVRNIGYTWDAAGQMTLWTDAGTNTNLAYSYDAAGNLSRVWSSDNVVDHRYGYDAANRLTTKTQGTATTLEAYTYDAYGNRATYNDGSSTATYTWNAANRVTQAMTTLNSTSGNASDDTRASWSHDKVGNVTRYEEFDQNAVSVYTQTSVYNQSYRTLTSATTNRRDAASISISSTQYTLDKSGRLGKEVTTDTSSATNVYTYTHAYTKDGRELSVTASGTGSLNGSSTSTYDANDRLSRIDLGTPDSANSSAAFKLFRYSNDGQILSGFHDNGVAADQDVSTEYLYANGNIVGQKGNSTASTTVVTVLDQKAYSLVDALGADHPSGALSSYEVQFGDTLQSIAAKQYGNPSLWYVIADINDLRGSESLKPGSRLMLPDTTETGRLTADNFVVYNESGIIGSRLPNLKAPPPPEPDKCAQAAAIILTILVSIVAVVVTVLTAGALAPLAIAAAGVTATSAAGIIIGATVGAVVGATIGLASGAINQGIKIGLKVQTEFNWKEVAADVAAGAIGGVGAAFSGVAQASIKAAVTAQQLSTNLGRLARVATVLMDSAINVAGEASSQAITYNGRIEEPWMLGVAGGAGILGEALKPLGSRAWRAIRPTAVGDAAGSAIKPGAGKVFRFSDSSGKIVSGTANALTGASDNSLAATLRKADVQLGSRIGGKQELTVRFADDALTGNHRTSAYTPVSWNDTAASTLSQVQSQSKLDQVADLASLTSARKMLAGETGGFDQAKVNDFAQGSVGKVRDNSIPVSQLDTATPSSARLSQAQSPGDRWSRDIDALLSEFDNVTPSRASVSQPKLDDAPDLRVSTPDAGPVKTDLAAPQTGRRGRALGQAETSLPEPSLDLRETIAQSRVARAFDFNMLDADPKQARKVLEDYFAGNNLTLSKSPSKLARQVQEERAYLKALKPRGLVGKREIELQLNAFDQKVSAYEISRSSPTRKLLSTYQDLRSGPLASGPGARNQQFLDIDDSLGQVLSDPKLSQATRLLVKNEMQLIRDTVSDAQIMKSAYVLNPSHAMELKRLGLQPSAAGRIGEFTDVRLTGNMTKLGSGNLNTVYIGNYTLPDGGGAYKGVFKPEVRQWTDAPTSGVYLGIDPLNPRAGYRNVATTRLDDALGFNLITRSEMAIHNNELGTVSELARGVSPKAGKMKSNEVVPDDVIAAHASTGKPGAPLRDDWVDEYNATRGESRMIHQETVDGRQRYVYEGTAVHDINYEDPRLRRDLVRLHLMDAISGQVDRHHGNYFVLADHAGKVIDVKAIDNDLSWGNNLKMVEVFDTGWHTRPEDAIHLPKYLPPVVDKEAYDAVMALNRQTLSKKMGGLLNSDEVDAAAQRLRLVQDHLKTLEAQGRVLASRDEWASPQVTKLLMERKDGRVTNYIAREAKTIDKARAKGVLLAYPENRMATPA